VKAFSDKKSLWNDIINMNIALSWKRWMQIKQHYEENVTRIRTSGIPMMSESNERLKPLSKEDIMNMMKQEYEKQCDDSSFQDLRDFVKVLNERLDKLKELTNIESVSDPENNCDLLKLAEQCLLLRQCVWHHMEEYASLEDLMAFCTEFDMEPSYRELISQYYKPTIDNIKDMVYSCVPK
jgi:hypothetical protein